MEVGEEKRSRCKCDKDYIYGNVNISCLIAHASNVLTTIKFKGFFFCYCCFNVPGDHEEVANLESIGHAIRQSEKDSKIGTSGSS